MNRAKIISLADNDTKYLIALWAPVPTVAWSKFADPAFVSVDVNITVEDLTLLRGGEYAEKTIKVSVLLSKVAIRDAVVNAWTSFGQFLQHEALAVPIGAYWSADGVWSLGVV